MTSLSGFFASIGMPEIVAAIMLVALNAYVLMGGADYGGGLWDLVASGRRRDEQRALIANSIGPIWEANHVWLIVVVVMLFTAFPVAFGAVGIVLHIPLTLMLVGIVMRGSAFVFRSYGNPSHAVRKRWGAAFASASIGTPILLGTVIGAIASGAVGNAADQTSAGATASTASFVGVYVMPWLAPFPLAVGGFTLALFAYLAAVYLTVEARRDDLREDFRNRALAAALMVFVFAVLALLLARSWAPRVAAGVMGSPWSVVLHACTAAAAITAIVALWQRRYSLARIAAAAQVSLILWGWALSQYPYMLPTTRSIRDSAAPAVTLRLLLIGLAAGAAILLPSLRYLFRTFAGRAGEMH
jgi:cytochrome bd ubiquinol oxidase subunit II